MLVLVVLGLIIAGYIGAMVYDVYFLRRRFGAVAVRVRLRRDVANALFFGLVLGAVLYHQWAMVEARDGLRIAMLFVLLLLELVQGFRQRYWLLNAQGMVAGGRIWRYGEVARLLFLEDRVVVAFFNRPKALVLYPTHLEDVQAAGEFLFDCGVFQARINESEEQV